MSRIVKAFLENEAALKRFLSRFFSRAEDIDDVSQETFLKAFAAEAEREIRAPKAFLYRIARNTALNELSKKARSDTTSIVDSHRLDVIEDERQAAVDDQVAARQKLVIFAHAVAELPPQCRRVFLLRKVYGLSHKDIAERQGISVSTVEKHVATGLVKCMEYLRQHGHDLEDFGAAPQTAARKDGTEKKAAKSSRKRMRDE